MSSSNTLNWLQLVGVAIALATFCYSIWTTRQGNKRAHLDRTGALDHEKAALKWRQAVEAQSAITRLVDHPAASQALKMLDYSGRYYQLRDGTWAKIGWAEMRKALRTESGRFTKSEVLIRDCFDALFDQLTLMQQQIDSEIYTLSAVRHQLSYYAKRMRRSKNWLALGAFLDTYEYPGAKKLIESADSGVEDHGAERAEDEPARMIDEPE